MAYDQLEPFGEGRLVLQLADDAAPAGALEGGSDDDGSRPLLRPPPPEPATELDDGKRAALRPACRHSSRLRQGSKMATKAGDIYHQHGGGLRPLPRRHGESRQARQRAGRRHEGRSRIHLRQHRGVEAPDSRVSLPRSAFASWSASSPRLSRRRRKSKTRPTRPA